MGETKKDCKSSPRKKCDCQSNCEEKLQEEAREDWEEIKQIRYATLNYPLEDVLEHHGQLQVAKALMLMGMQCLYSVFDGDIEEANKFLQKLVPFWWATTSWEMPIALAVQKAMERQNQPNSMKN